MNDSRWELIKAVNDKIEKMLNIGSEIARKTAEIRLAVFEGRDTIHLCFELRALEIAHRKLVQDIEEEQANIRALYQESASVVA